MGLPTVSAGGIIVRHENGTPLIVIVEREKDIEEKWQPILRQLPKGGCHPGETLEETAQREVLEETGYRVRITGEAGEAMWSYTRNNQVYDETVHYYIMLPLSSTAGHHDSEFEFVRWIEAEEAAKILSYPEERDLVSKLIERNALFR